MSHIVALRQPHRGGPSRVRRVTIGDVSKAERPSEMKIMAGLRLRAVREHLGIGQEAMANVLGTTRTALSNWENGERLADVAAMVRLYTRTGITLEWIYAGSAREMNYEKGEDLIAKAAELGAVVGGPVAEWPQEVERRPGIQSLKPPAAAPRKRTSSGGYLHDRPKEAR